MKRIASRVRSAFEERFETRPTHLVRAPGRVNLIGEHTDYSGGFAMPLALEEAVWIALRAREDRRVRLHSLDYGEVCELDLEAPPRAGEGWREYPKAVAWALAQEGRQLAGWEGVVAGDLPQGAGLASSAALQLAVALSFAVVMELDWQPRAFAKLVQRAENEWVGVRCGILDPLASACAVEGHALRIDCRSLAVEPVPLPHDSRLLVLDTATRRDLVDSAYNERRAQCEEIARSFDKAQLRDLSSEELEAGAATLEPVLLRRARHVVGENLRVEAAARAMRAGDSEPLGELMTHSHTSLRDDFEVSSPALDAIVESALAIPGCFGARMTGAGFGGCALALVAASQVEAFTASLPGAYLQRSGLEASILPCTPSRGAECLELRR
ncbi:MAG: galactokinase [Myxococcales bacterium]|nr:galactokinase [Myxococcales bacterium]